MHKAMQYIWIISALAVIVLSVTPGGQPAPEAFGLDKILHFSAYAWLSVLPVSQLRKQINVSLAILCILLLGGMLELCQNHVPGRTSSQGDMIANAAGVATGSIIGLLGRWYAAQRQKFGF